MQVVEQFVQVIKMKLKTNLLQNINTLVSNSTTFTSDLQCSF